MSHNVTSRAAQLTICPFSKK